MNTLITICARGGSKGVKNKALVNIKKKPLIWYTLNKIPKLKFSNKTVISTDSIKISKVCNIFGFKTWFKRSKYLSSDKAPKIPVIRDALIKAEKHYKMEFDIIIDLDISSPLRSVADINNAYSQFIESKCDNLFSVMVSRHSPYFNMVEKKNNKIKLVKKYINIIRRQDTPTTYDMNASIYIWKKDILLKSNKLFNKNTELFLMPYERSIDIDNYTDLKIVKNFI